MQEKHTLTTEEDGEKVRKIEKRNEKNGNCRHKMWNSHVNIPKEYINKETKKKKKKLKNKGKQMK